MTVLNANEIGYYDLNKKIVECDDNDITITDAMGQRYIGCGVAGKTITVEGTPGNALGAYLDGSTIIVHGNGQDAIGDDAFRQDIRKGQRRLPCRNTYEGISRILSENNHRRQGRRFSGRISGRRNNNRSRHRL